MARDRALNPVFLAGLLLALTAACDSSDELFPPNGSLRLVLQDSGLAVHSSAEPRIQVMQWTLSSATAEFSLGTFDFLNESPCDHFRNAQPVADASTCLNTGFSFGPDVAEPVTVRLAIDGMEVRRARFPNFLDNTPDDNDSIAPDGDGSGIVGDAPCEAGETMGCDDNCPTQDNEDQARTGDNTFGDACAWKDSEGNPTILADQDQDGIADLGDLCIWEPTTAVQHTDDNHNEIGDDCEETALVDLDAPSPLVRGPVDVIIEDGRITTLLVDFDNTVTLSCDWVCNGLSCSNCRLSTQDVTLTAVNPN